jgi:hypothetical protein
MRAWILVSIPLGLILSFSGNDEQGVKPQHTPPEATQALTAALDSRLKVVWSREQVEPAPEVDSLTFARRLWLDLLGTIPSLAELRELEAVPAGEQRAWIVEKVMADPRFNESLAERLARIAVGGGEAKKDDLIYRRGRLVVWLTAQVKSNRAYDDLVTDLLTGEGLSTDSPAVNYTISQDADPLKLAARTTRAFLGLRIDCAQCHDHPFTHWKQRDFEGLAAFFARVEQNLAGVRDKAEGELEFQLPGEGMSMAGPTSEDPATKDPATKDPASKGPAPDDDTHRDYGADTTAEPGSEDPDQEDEPLVRAPFGQPVRVDPKKPRPEGIKTRVVAPRVPFSAELLTDELLADGGLKSRRRQLAAWVTHPENPYFAKALVNRFWQWLLGRGVVEPVDELDTSKPRDKLLLGVLAESFRLSGYDLRHLVRAIVSSRAYAVASAAPEGMDVEAAEDAWALRPLKALRGDQLGSAVLQSGSLRAYDASRAPLLRLAFWAGRNGFIQRHADDLAQEDPEEETLLQRLHLLNGEHVSENTKDGELFNLSSRLPLLSPTDELAVDTAFLVTLTRRPSQAERDYFLAKLREAGDKGDERSKAMADLLWCLLNTTEFSWIR